MTEGHGCPFFLLAKLMDETVKTVVHIIPYGGDDWYYTHKFRMPFGYTDEDLDIRIQAEIELIASIYSPKDIEIFVLG